MCMAKLHRVTVKQADLNSVGSITIDEALLEASGIGEYRYVNITNHVTRRSSKAANHW